MEIATIPIGSADDFLALSPIRRELLRHFLDAIKSRARIVQHEAGPSRSRLAREIDGIWHDLESIPEAPGGVVAEEIRDWLHPSPLRRNLADGLRTLADRLDPRRVTAVEYQFLLIVGTSWTIWKVTIQSVEDLTTTTFELLDCSERNREAIVLES